MNSVKVERFYCLKCSRLVELPYHPEMLTETRTFFDEIKEASLCKPCLPVPIKKEKIYLM